jgi:restriction system protein
MAIPDFQILMLPLMRLAEQGEQSVPQATDLLAAEFQLSETERAQLLPSGRQSTFSNRIHWALTHLVHAGLLERPRRGHFIATEQGKQVLLEGPDRIDMNLLSKFDSYVAFRQRRPSEASDEGEAPLAASSETPEERIDEAVDELTSLLRKELLERVVQMSPRAFEQLIVQLMLGMGYGSGGSGQHLGRTNDQGVDGVINEDVLGLDTIYLQAKRYAPGNGIGVEKIREFAGALDERRATRGVFVTTSYYAPQAREYAERSPKRLILIDGEELTSLMVKYGIAVRTFRAVELKKLDNEYLEELGD